MQSFCRGEGERGERIAFLLGERGRWWWLLQQRHGGCDGEYTAVLNHGFWVLFYVWTSEWRKMLLLECWREVGFGPCWSNLNLSDRLVSSLVICQCCWRMEISIYNNNFMVQCTRVTSKSTDWEREKEDWPQKHSHIRSLETHIISSIQFLLFLKLFASYSKRATTHQGHFIGWLAKQDRFSQISSSSKLPISRSF